MKMKSILSVALALVTALALTTTTFAETPITNTITFNSYTSPHVNAEATVKITNVVSTETKDFSTYLSDDDVTIEGTNSQVLTCKAPVTLTLMPNKGTKATGAFEFSLYYDSNLVPADGISKNTKFYKFNVKTLKFDFKKKLNKVNKGVPCGIADGSQKTITAPGTYVLYVDTAIGVDPSTMDKTPVFLIVE